MSVNKEFETYKVKREIQRSGKFYEFFRQGYNMFGEPNESETTSLGYLSGIFHQHNSTYVSVATAAETRYRKKLESSILCLFADIRELGLMTGDYTIINNKPYCVTSVRDIQEWNEIAEVDLEIMDMIPIGEEDEN